MLWCALMLFLASADLFIAPKMVLGWLLGLANPADLGTTPGSWDLALLLGYSGIVVYGAWLHPIVGLVMVTLVRPWLDGYTFPVDNHYFLWGVLLCFAVWAVKALLRGDRMAFLLPLSLLAAFILTALALSPTSYNLGNTYRILLLWVGYLFLFALAANATDNRKVWGIAIGGIALTYFAQNLFSIFQYHYLLPYLRVLLDQRPELLQSFFNTSEFTPELANRLNRNRAFGTMLFPNAMAGFLVLGIPLALVGAWTSLQDALPAWRKGRPMVEQRERMQSLALATVVGIFVALLVFFLIQFPAMYALEALPWYADMYMSALIALLVGIGLSAALFAMASVKGVKAIAISCQALFLSVLAVTLIYGLAITYSRGAMAALVLAIIIMALAYILRERLIKSSFIRFLPPVAAACLVLFALFHQQNVLAETAETDAPQTVATDEQPPMPPAFVTQEGVNLSMQDMTDVATLRLRLDYWRVGARIFQHNMLTGVGLGNFQWSYPLHQRLGEGDVREAHNSFLQAYTETGIVGGSLLILFWTYVVFWGFRQFMHQPDPRVRRWILALLAGLLAFLLHAAFDINFQHPSLMFFAFLFTGLLFATPKALGATQTIPAETDAESEAASDRKPLLSTGMTLIAALTIAALVLGVSMRSHIRALALSRVAVLNIDVEADLKHRQAVMNFFFETMADWARNRTPQKPSIPTRSALALISDPNDLAKMGPIYIPTPGRAQGWRQLQVGEVIPSDAVVVIERPWDSLELARIHGQAWLSNLERIDSRFPHDAQLAAYIARQYGTMATALAGPRWEAYRKEALVRQLHWAERAVERNPYFADLHALLAHAISFRGWIESNPAERANTHAQALQSLKRAADLAPNIPHYLSNLAFTYERIAENYEAAGKTSDAEKARAEARRFRAESDAIWQRRIELRLPI